MKTATGHKLALKLQRSRACANEHRIIQWFPLAAQTSDILLSFSTKLARQFNDSNAKPAA